MKTIRLKLLTLMSVIGIALPITSQAYDFFSDGIYYNILSEEGRTVEVTHTTPFLVNQHDYEGNVSIPPKVIYTSKSYSVTKIGDMAFHSCTGLTSVDIPNSVTSIEGYAFSGCTGLTSVDIPSSVTSIGESAFKGCTGLTSVVIPGSVTTIGSGAFYGCTGLTSVDIPNSVTSIEGYAFFGCTGLTSVDIPSSVTSIGMSAFWRCTGLTSVDIPSSVTSIGESAFSGCTGLTSVDIPSSVTDIHYSAFSRCDKLSIINVQQDNPNYISMDGVLYSKKEGVVTSVVKCPEGKKGIIKIPSSVTTIGNRAFECCSGLTSVDIPSSVTTIEYAAFEGCSGLTSVDIPSSVTSIGKSAFKGCTGLTSLNIGNSVTTIDTEAFKDINDLEKIYCHWEKPVEFSLRTFEEKVLKNATLYVPIGTKAKYEKVDPWRNFWNIEEIDYESISGIKDVVGSEELTLEETDRFDISGKHVSEDYKGLVIIRYSDGSTRKTIIK